MLPYANSSRSNPPFFPSLIMSLILSAIFNRNILTSNALMWNFWIKKKKKKRQESSQSNLNPISIILGITKIENKNCLISTIIGCRCCCRYAHYWQIQTQTILLSPRLLVYTRPTKPSVRLPLELGLRNMRALDLISV